MPNTLRLALRFLLTATVVGMISSFHVGNVFAQDVENQRNRPRFKIGATRADEESKNVRFKNGESVFVFRTETSTSNSSIGAAKLEVSNAGISGCSGRPLVRVTINGKYEPRSWFFGGPNVTKNVKTASATPCEYPRISGETSSRTTKCSVTLGKRKYDFALKAVGKEKTKNNSEVSRIEITITNGKKTQIIEGLGLYPAWYGDVNGDGQLDVVFSSGPERGTELYVSEPDRNGDWNLIEHSSDSPDTPC